MNDTIGISPEITKEDRLWATFCHLGGFSFFLLPPLGHLLVPLVLWLLKRHDSAYIDEHGKESLNFQISITIYGSLFLILLLFLIGIPLLMILFVYWVACMIYASVQANDGMSFRYPLTIRFL